MSTTKYRIDVATLYMAVAWAIMALTIRGDRHSEVEIASILGLSLDAKKTIRGYVKQLSKWHVIWRITPPKKHYGRGRNTFFAIDPYRIPEEVWRTQISGTTIFCRKKDAVKTGYVCPSGKSDYFLDGKSIYAMHEDLIRKSLKDGLRREGKRLGLAAHEIERVIIRDVDEDKIIDGMNNYRFEIEPNFLEIFRNYLISIYHFEYSGVALS